MLLPSLISLRRPLDHVLSPEDIFSSSLGSLWRDDLQNQHGDDPSTTIIYRSRKHGDLEFRTAELQSEEQRTKFAHYLWNASILMGECIGGKAGGDEREYIDMEGLGEEDVEDGWWVSEEEEQGWCVRGERVLELGAGSLR